MPQLRDVLHWAALLLLLRPSGGRALPGPPAYPHFTRNDTDFQHLLLHPDPAVGTVYVGARDHLFQLDGLGGLGLQQEETTGPVKDSKDCLPPVTEANCPQAQWTSNHNQLLLVDPWAAELITCGSVHQGTCQKRSLTSVSQVLFSSERPVDTQYVAANDPRVATVGLVARPRGGERVVMYVGRGYTASHPPISTRQLTSLPLFSYEETAKLAVAGRLSEYDHHFVAAFARRSHAYFLFYRRDIQAPSREYRTYVARVCLGDVSYYSYVELPLLCRSSSSSSSTPRTYNLLQAAQVGQSRGSDGDTLLGVFAAHLSSSSTSTSSKPTETSEASALCRFSLDQLDRSIDSTRDLCYTQDGRVEGGGQVAYIEYEVKSSCATLLTNTLEAYPCGSDHTPSPMASRIPLEAEAVLVSRSARLTAVAVDVREGHSVAFLGDSKGNLHKVFLGSDGQVKTYAVSSVRPDAAIHSDLLLDHSRAQIYIMTSNTVEKRPVAECGDHLDCDSCLSARDPYCGWCVLDGRCGLREDCQRGTMEGHWLWSFLEAQQCLSIQELNVYNVSRGDQTPIRVSVPGLPALGREEVYSCFFQDTEAPAMLSTTGVTCSTPDAGILPLIGQGDDSVMVTLSLRFLNVTVAETQFTFFNCSLVQLLSGRRPCQGCVGSRWGCNWCIHQHLCTHKHTCDHGVTIYNQKVETPIPTNSQTAKPVAHPIPTVLAGIPTTIITMPMTAPTPTTVTTTTTTATTPQLSPTAPHSQTTEAVSPTTPSATRTTPSPSAIPSSVSPSSQAATDPHTGALWSSSVAPLTPASGGMEGDHHSTAGTTAEGIHGSGSTEVSDGLAAGREPPYSYSKTTLPSSASGKEGSDRSTIEPTADSVGWSSSDLSSTASSALRMLAGSGEEVPLGHSEELLTDISRMDEGKTVTEDPALSSAWPSGAQGTEQQTHSVDHEVEPGNAALYQSDAADSPRLLECPCVEKVESSSLLPVNVESKITLLGQHLHLFQDEDLDYECVLDVESGSVAVEASVETHPTEQTIFLITCQLHQYTYKAQVEEYRAVINIRRRNSFVIDSAEDLHVTLFNCSVGRSDCSRCRTAEPRYGCAWCTADSTSSCVYGPSCTEEITHTCPAPVIHFIDPVSGPVEGGTVVTISGSNLGQKPEDVENSVTVAGVPCHVIPSRYEVSSRIVCETTGSGAEKSGQAVVSVRGGGHGRSTHVFSFQDPILTSVSPLRGPKAGGSRLSIRGHRLRTGHAGEVSVAIGGVPCLVLTIDDDQINCQSGSSNRTGDHGITVRFGGTERHLQGITYHYTPNPNITRAAPSKSFLRGGRTIRVSGHNLDVVQEPKLRVTLSPPDPLPPRRRRRAVAGGGPGAWGRLRRIVPEPDCPEGTLCGVKQHESLCTVVSSSMIQCNTPAVGPEARRARVRVHFLLDSLQFEFSSVSGGGGGGGGGEAFSYQPDPMLFPLNRKDRSKPYHHKPGSIISVEGVNLDLAISKEEVVALIGDGVCTVKTLTHHHLYCEPPAQQPPRPVRRGEEGLNHLPEFTVQMGNLNFSLGRVQYDSQAQMSFPPEAQVGVGVGASVVALMVLIIVLIYRRKSKQAMRDYKKVQIQLENLETSVRDRCKKEFTDLMTEMMDMSSDLVGSGIPFLQYRTYAERIFFPGHQESPLRRELDVPEGRRQTVEQGLVQLSNLLNSKLFLTKFIHTLEVQRTFSPRDRAYVASLLTVALHGKLEYFTDILKTLLSDLVEQYVAKNPKLMLRRTESVVEKLLTNWMSICLFTFLRESAGESFYMLFRAIKHQVDKGPVDAVSGKAKYTLNDNRLLREDVEYRTLTLNVLIPAPGADAGSAAQTAPAKVLDCDTITQVKEKVLEQTWKGTSFSQRPHVDSLNLEWRAGVAGHLILSDEDLTSITQGSWKRLNTIQHYKLPDGATVALVPRNGKHQHHYDSHDYMPGEKTPMLDDGEEGGVRLWHLVKANEEAELPKQRKGSVRERGGERAKAIPEIYLTRLLSMKGTLQKFVDDLFTAILSTSRPVPLAVKYFFDMLDEQASLHNITDPETIHIWKTNSLPLRFWINILKNPQFIFDVQASDHVDAVLSVIAQTFMDSCTRAEHKLGRDSPINKLLYARDIPRYKHMVERYYADIRQAIPASDQEMNSALAELSRNYAGEVNHLVALHELYKYINKYYDQIITALEEDTMAQKMQLGYRLQQVAAAVENKVTDL